MMYKITVIALLASIILFVQPAKSECLDQRIIDLETSVKAYNRFNTMDTYSVWMAEIGKVKNDQAYMRSWLKNAEEKINSLTAPRKSETNI